MVHETRIKKKIKWLYVQHLLCARHFIGSGLSPPKLLVIIPMFQIKKKERKAK